MKSSLIIICLLFLSSCITRKKLKAYLWLNNAPIPVEICEREPLLKDYGFFRRLNDGNFEFVSFCNDKAKEFFSMHKDDLEKLLKENVQD